MRFPLKAALPCALAIPLFSVTASPALGAIPSSCGGVLQGSGDSGTLTKTITRVTENADGSTTIKFRYTSDRGAGTFRLRDCAFIDANSNGMYDKGEEIVAGTQKKGVPSSGTGTITVTATIPEGAQLCDRLALSGTASDGTGFTDKSNIACVGGGYPPSPY